MTEPQSTVAKATDALAGMNVMADAVVGYRNKLLEGGFTVETAERIAEAYHQTLLESMKAASAANAVGQIFGRGGKR